MLGVPLMFQRRNRTKFVFIAKDFVLETVFFAQFFQLIRHISSKTNVYKSSTWNGLDNGLSLAT